jgi:hypothetical protein
MVRQQPQVSVIAQVQQIVNGYIATSQPQDYSTRLASTQQHATSKEINMHSLHEQVAEVAENEVNYTTVALTFISWTYRIQNGPMKRCSLSRRAGL